MRVAGDGEQSYIPAPTTTLVPFAFAHPIVEMSHAQRPLQRGSIKPAVERPPIRVPR
jgi:hypothetical protein